MEQVGEALVFANEGESPLEVDAEVSAMVVLESCPDQEQELVIFGTTDGDAALQVKEEIALFANDSPMPEPIAVAPATLDPAQLVVQEEAAARTRKRARKPTERQLEEERKRSFRASQKMLRMEAPSFCIKDALSRSMTMISEVTNSQAGDSLVGMMPSTPAASSAAPAVQDITNRFLSKVHASRSTVIDNIVRKDKTQIASRQPMMSFEEDAASELVFEDENANLEIPDHTISMHDFERTSGPNNKRESNVSQDQADDQHQREEEDRLTMQLRRKHEMLRLRSSVLSQENSQPTANPSPVATPLIEVKMSSAAPLPKMQQVGMTMASRQAGLQQRAATFLKVVSGDVQHLKRTNSFDNSGSKPIVFAAAEKPKKAQ